MEESFNIFNQFDSFFIFSLKLVLGVRNLAFLDSSFQLPVLCVAIVLYCMAFFFLLTPMHYYGYFSIYPWSSSFFSISTTCYRYWFLAICCDVCFKLTYIFSNYRWLDACKIIYNRWQVAMPRSDNVRYKFCLVPKISFTYINFIHT